MTSKIKVNILADGADNSIITSDGAGSFTSSSSLASSVQSVGGIQMTPAFHVRLTANQNVTSQAQTKVSLNDITLDTDSCWDAVNYRFQPTVAGKYYIFGSVTCQGTANNVLVEATSSFRLNGSRIVTGSQTFNTSTFACLYSATVSSIITFDGSTQYVELWGRTQVSSGTAQFTPAHEFATYMGGYRIIGA